MAAEEGGEPALSELSESKGALTERQRETLLSVAFALWGLAIGIALLDFWNRPAPPGQLPGTATAHGFDAHGPFRWMVGLILLPALVPLVLRPVARLLASGAPWARNAVLVAPLLVLWFVTLRGNIWWTILPFAGLIAVCVLLRHRDLEFTRRDIVLIPVLLTTYLGMLDRLPSVPVDILLYTTLLLVFALRIAVTFIPSPLPPALSFIAAPLALALQTGFFARDQRYFGWHAVAIVILTPFLLRLFLRDLRRATAFLTLFVYPIALFCYADAASVRTAEGKPRVDFFEDGHSLVPASEYARGERPYRDVLPTHGMISDGLFDLASMQMGETIGTVTRARHVAGNLCTVALYAVAVAVTGSAEGAFLAVLFAFLTGMYQGTLRLLPALVTLAFIAAAVRRRRPRLFGYAGFGAVVAGASSIDFGAYTFITLVVALVRTQGERLRTFRAAAVGLLAGVIPLAAGLMIAGVLGDFFRTTFIELPGVASAYTTTFFTPPPDFSRLRAFPDVLAAVTNVLPLKYLFWCAVTVFVGATITRRAPRRLEPLIVAGVWIVVTGLSYAERHHLYFIVLAPLFAVYAVVRLLPRHKAIAAALILAFVAIAAPTTHLGVLGWMRQMRGPLEPAWVEVPAPPRAKGALFHDSDAKVIASVDRYLSMSLRPDETFFDFANSGTLYFLFRRDCPIRFYEVPFYQAEDKQREVIDAIDRNPKVRAVLLPASPLGRFTIDGIPNAERVPLVWQYIQTHFEPDFQEGEVVFWRRR